MTTPSFDVVVVGGGIVGLATAHAVARTGRSVAVVEREPQLARHQTGNNSNVIHSGLYYAPGGYKARLAVAAAVSSGVEGLEAAAIVSAADAVEADGLAAVRDLTPSAPVHLAGPDGALRTSA